MKQVRTETGNFNRYGLGEAVPEDQTPIFDLVLEVVGNFKRVRLAHCPFFSSEAEVCVFDDIAELIGDVKDRHYARQLVTAFAQVIPFDKARAVIFACGDELMCNGMREKEESYADDERSRLGIQRAMLIL